jgi:hypothetical protein
MSVVDLFFYEELSRVAGQETGSQWLRTTVRHVSKKRKMMSGQRSPDFSRPSSPRSWASSVDSNTNMDKGCAGTAVSGTPSSESSIVPPRKLHLDFLPNLHDQLSQDVDMFKAACRSSPKQHALTTSSESRIGLIFTDAAHTVLDE